MKNKILSCFKTLDPHLCLDLFENYYNHIETATYDDNQYIERHHILPKSIFPEYIKDDWNIAKLTAKDHFIAHHNLFKMFPSHPKIVAAMWGMCNQVSPNHQREFLEDHKYEISSLYAQVREAHAQNVRLRQLTNNPMKGRTGESSPLYGKKRPKEVVEKMKQNHWSRWRKPWNHNKARKDAWILACSAYDLWVQYNCGYVRLDSLLNKPPQTFKTIHQHFKQGWNPHDDSEFQRWLSLHIQDLS